MGLLNRARRKALAAATSAGRRPVMETLEQRTFLSVTVTPVVDQTPPTNEPLIIPVSASDTAGLPLTFTPSSNVGNITATVDAGPLVEITFSSATASANGDLIFQLLPGVAPNTVTNFLNLVNSGFYNGLEVPQVVPNFIVQAGSPFDTTAGGPGYTIDDEYSLQAIFDGSGQLAMANSGSSDTNGSQFFVTTQPEHDVGFPANSGLDFDNTIFGQLVGGSNGSQPDTYANGVALLTAIDSVPVPDPTNGGAPDTPITMTSVAQIQNNTSAGAEQFAVVTIDNTGAGAGQVTIEANDGTTNNTTAINVTPTADNITVPPILGPIQDQMTNVNTPVSYNLSAQQFGSATLLYASTVEGPTKTNVTVTSGSPTITLENTLNLAVGMGVSDSLGDVPASTTILSLTGNSIMLSNNVTATGSGDDLTFNPNIDQESVNGNQVTVTPDPGFTGIDHVLVGVADQDTDQRGSERSGDPYDTQSMDVYVGNVETPDAVYVAQLYDQFLNRGVDAPSLDSRLIALANGDSRLDQALSVENSAEAYYQYVNNDFEALLSRDASTSELATYVGQIEGGASLENVKEAIIATPEFYSDAGGTNAGFITAVYEDVLNRLPDAGGLSNFEAAMTGGATQLQIAQDIVGSTEAYIVLVSQDYHRFLDRAPDSGGLNNFVTQIENGASDQLIAAEIIGSTEYENTTDANINFPASNPVANFVTLAYQDLLNRSPDVGGMINFSIEAGVSGRSQVASDLVSSLEYTNIQVSSIYQQLLARSADPGGLNYFDGVLAAGTPDTVREIMADSQEFFNDAGDTNAGFVNLLNTDMLGGNATSMELNTWNTDLNTGSTRDQVVQLLISGTDYQDLEINTAYQQFLNRAPDTGGQTYFENQLSTNHNTNIMAIQIIASQEFFNDAQI